MRTINALAIALTMITLAGLTACDEPPAYSGVNVPEGPLCPEGELLDERSGECIALPDPEPEVQPEPDPMPEPEPEVQPDPEPEPEDPCTTQPQLVFAQVAEFEASCEPGFNCKVLHGPVTCLGGSCELTDLVSIFDTVSENTPDASREFAECSLLIARGDEQPQVLDTTRIQDRDQDARFSGLSLIIDQDETVTYYIECLAGERIELGVFAARIPSPQHIGVQDQDGNGLCFENVILPEGGVNGDHVQTIEIKAHDVCADQAQMTFTDTIPRSETCPTGEYCNAIEFDIACEGDEGQLCTIDTLGFDLQNLTQPRGLAPFQRFEECDLEMQIEGSDDYETIATLTVAENHQNLWFTDINRQITTPRSVRVTCLATQAPNDGSRYALILSTPLGIRADDQNGNAYCITENVQGSGVNTGHQHTMVVEDVDVLPGLTIRTASDTPLPRILLPEQDVHVATFEAITGFQTNYEIQSLTFENCVAHNEQGECIELGDDRAIAQVQLVYEDLRENTTRTFVGALSGGRVTFEQGMDFIVPALIYHEFELRVTTNSGDIIRSGDQFQFHLVGFSAVHTRLREVITEEDFPQTAASSRFQVYLTKPTISLSVRSPEGDAVPTPMSDVFVYNVTADSRGALEVVRTTFEVYAFDNDNTGWNSCANLGDEQMWELRDEIGELIETDMLFVTEDGRNCANNPDADVVFISTAMRVRVDAGRTQEFHLRANTLGASRNADDTLQISIPAETRLGELPLDAFLWEDENGDLLNGHGIVTLPLRGGTLLF